MSREDAATKARRLLVEGRLIVERVDAERIKATCRGDSGDVYLVGWDGSRWYCTCAAFGACSHRKALWLVTIKPRPRS